MKSRVTLASCFLAAALSVGTGSLLSGRPAAAQQLVATVNGDPVTSYDVEQRIKLLRVLKRPASRPEAIESLIDDRVKLKEMSKYQISASDQDLITQGARDAAKAKISPAALGAGLQSSRIDEQHWKDHFKAEYVWNAYIAALNKTVEISEEDVRKELAKRGKSSSITEYVLRQVVLVVPASGGAAAVEGRLREALGLRSRFTDCTSGMALAKAMNEVAVKEPTTRNSSALNEKLQETLDHTEQGHLTPPERTATGVEMIAVCQKKNVRDDNTAGADIRNELLYNRLEGESQRVFKELRSHAVIVRG